MALLRTIESRIARLVEGTFGKVFRSSVQPVEIARRLVREMDEHQQRTVRSVYVPNSYEVFLSRDDHRQLSQYAAALTSELGEYLAEHARRNGYALLTRPRVQLRLDRDLGLGQFGIAAAMQQPDDGTPLADDAPAASAPSATAVFQAPVVEAPPTEPTAVTGGYALTWSGGRQALSGSRMGVGRGSSNELVLHDPSVSREHAELVAADSDSGWMVRDLDSTNGVKVNGARVREQALNPGDVVLFGTAKTLFDRAGRGV